MKPSIDRNDFCLKLFTPLISYTSHNDNGTVCVGVEWIGPVNSNRNSGDSKWKHALVHQGWVQYSIMMLVTFLTSANQKHWIWSSEESGLCHPRPRLLGDEVVVGSSLMFRKMDPWNAIRKYTAGQDQEKINCKEKWYHVGKMTFSIYIYIFFIRNTWIYVWNWNFIWKVPLVSPTQI